MLTITPSLPAQSFDELRTLAETLSHTVPMFQIDIVDGVFVPNVSWPFTEGGDPKEVLRSLATLPASLPLEVDCMIVHPETYLDLFVELGIASVIIHMGSTDEYDGIISHARTHGYQIGFAITNDARGEILNPYVAKIDFVQIMGIAHVGKQGEPFDTRTLSTLSTLRALYPTLPLVVDGAVNAETIVKLRDAGATRFAPGSAIAHSSDPLQSYKQLCVLLGI